LFQLQSVVRNGAVTQLAKTKTTVGKKTSKRRTISGHGKLRRDNKKVMMKFKVPKGKTIMRPAPPGATLGNLSMLLNEQKGLSRKELLKKMKVSTTKDLWTNKHVIGIIKANPNIPKTKGQEASMDKLLKGQTLTGPEKGALTRMESKSEFEQWVNTYVKNETFKTFGEGEEMEDMEFTPFESKLKSSSPHDENEYVKNKTNLSQYVSDPGINDCVVNACSWDEESPYTGFQIDQK
jgi:hypothetical protein